MAAGVPLYAVPAVPAGKGLARWRFNPSIGLLVGFKALVAVILGGIGSIPGALLGGLAIATVETAATALGLSQWKDAMIFGLLVAVLGLRPAGILGHPRDGGPEGRLGQGRLGQGRP